MLCVYVCNMCVARMCVWVVWMCCVLCVVCVLPENVCVHVCLCDQ